MESQLQRPSHGHQHHYEEDDPQHAGLHSVIEGEGDEQGEHHHHKSVLEKVKNKAKKIKDTIKKHGHGHEHGHGGGHRPEDIYQEEEDDDDEEEMVNDPEVHGAPMYESTVIRSTNLPRETNINVEKSKDRGDDKHEENLRDEGIARPLVPGPMAHEFEKPPAMAAHEPEYKNAPNVEKPKIKVGLEEDPHSPYNSRAETPHSNYQSKVADPTGDGDKDAEVAPLVNQFGNLNAHNVFEKKPEPEQRSGSHDQFAPQETPTSNPVGPGKPDSNPKIQDPASQNTIAGKISSAAAGTAVSAKNAVASMLGYGGGPQQGQDSSSKQSASAVVSEYAGNLAEKFRPGDEDKALSEAITDAFTNKERTAAEGPSVGRVTQSKEVTARLGPAAEKKREGEDALAAGAESSGQGVANRLKDAVGAWLGKSTGMRTAQDSVGLSYVSDASSASSQVGQGEEVSDRKKG